MSVLTRRAALALTVLLPFCAPAWAQTLAIVGATIIDGTGGAPIADGVVLIDGGRITAIGNAQRVTVPKGAERLEARGKFVIPGLIDAVNLAWFGTTVENLVKYEGRYDQIFVEGAQLALTGGITGVFATWRSHAPVQKARDSIRTGAVPGSSIYAGGNIIGFDGMFSADSFDVGAQVSKDFVSRINEEWEQGTGRRLQWMTPEEVRSAVREYIRKHDLDYIKYAASGHWMQGGYPIGQFIAFSPRVQRVIVEEGHRAGLSVQAHTTSVESIDLAIEAGLDMLTHGDISGPAPIPAETLRKLVERHVAVGVLPITQRNLEAREKLAPQDDFTRFVKVAKTNRRNMIKAGVTLVTGTEAWLKSAEEIAATQADEAVDPSLHAALGTAHFNALVALEEEGMDRMEILKSITSNVARAYKLDAKVGTLASGKTADLVILDASPLESARNYRTIHAVIKDGKIVDRNVLPVAPLITKPRSGSNTR